MWQSLFVSSVGGVVAAVSFAGLVQLWRIWRGREEAAAIREIVVRYRHLVLGAEDLSRPADSPDLDLLPDRKRALVYNRMLGGSRSNPGPLVAASSDETEAEPSGCPGLVPHKG